LGGFIQNAFSEIHLDCSRWPMLPSEAAGNQRRPKLKVLYQARIGVAEQNEE